MSRPLKKERRRYPRAKVKWPATVTIPHGQIEGDVENISLDGAFIIIGQEPLPLKGRFRMAIKPPNRQPLSITAKVIWTAVHTPDGGEPSFGMGVQFERICEGDIQFLEEIIANYLQGKN